jgi:hypothetical protein
MATAEKRFHIPSEEEIDKLLTDKDSINTQKQQNCTEYDCCPV